MDARITAVIATRLLGLVLLLLGAALAFDQAVAFIRFMRWLHWDFAAIAENLGNGGQFGLDLPRTAFSLCGLALGWYLLVRGRRVQSWLLAGLGSDCPKCHYSLRGAPGPTCPECGTPIQQPPG